MSSQITYNSFNLQSSTIITEKILHTSAPKNDFNSQNKARRDGSYLLSNYWSSKAISAQGTIIGSSVSNLDTLIDELKQNLAGENLNLDIGYAGGTRRYRATASDIVIDREHFNGSWCPFIIEFQCVDAFGRDTSETTVTQDNNTTSPFVKLFTMTGSFPAYPEITLTLQDGNNVTALKIENTVTDDSITITQSFSDSDVLIIDCDAMVVTLNGSEIDFTGVFPSFIIGINNVQVTVTGSPFDIDMDIVYTALYL